MPVQAATLFETIFPLIIKEKKLAAKVKGVVQFTVTGDKGGVWTMDLREGSDGETRAGKVDNPDLTIVLADSFLDDFVRGSYDAVDAIKTGKLGIVGQRPVFDALVAGLLAQTVSAGKAAAPGLQAPAKGGVGLR